MFKQIVELPNWLDDDITKFCYRHGLTRRNILIKFIINGMEQLEKKYEQNKSKETESDR